MEFLNDYLDRMCGIVMKHGGTIYKMSPEDGSILGWQLVDAMADHLYELRWTVRE